MWPFVAVCLGVASTSRLSCDKSQFFLVDKAPQEKIYDNGLLSEAEGATLRCFSLRFLFFKCLQLKITNIPKQHILGVDVLNSFGEKNRELQFWACRVGNGYKTLRCGCWEGCARECGSSERECKWRWKLGRRQCIGGVWNHWTGQHHTRHAVNMQLVNGLKVSLFFCG